MKSRAVKSSKGETPYWDRQCKRCGSCAVNPGHHGREKGIDLNLCDVCYWRARATEQVTILEFPWFETIVVSGSLDPELSASVSKIIGGMTHGGPSWRTERRRASEISEMLKKAGYRTVTVTRLPARGK